MMPYGFFLFKLQTISLILIFIFKTLSFGIHFLSNAFVVFFPSFIIVTMSHKLNRKTVWSCPNLKLI